MGVFSIEEPDYLAKPTPNAIPAKRDTLLVGATLFAVRKHFATSFRHRRLSIK
jgi:hypothetical protein